MLCISPSIRVEDFIESTLLKVDATKEDIHALCVEAVQRGFYGVCVRPEWADWAKSCLLDSTVKLVVVVGFHDGSVPTHIKCSDVDIALGSGADEIDMVVNLERFRAGDYDAVTADVAAVVRAAAGKPVKAILETHLVLAEFGESRLRLLCDLVAEGGARFLKTCTGFTGGGATVETVRILRSVASGYEGIGVKASGGVRTAETAIAMVDAGAKRLGTSSGRAIADGWATALEAHCAGMPTGTSALPSVDAY